MPEWLLRGLHGSMELILGVLFVNVAVWWSKNCICPRGTCPAELRAGPLRTGRESPSAGSCGRTASHELRKEMVMSMAIRSIWLVRCLSWFWFCLKFVVVVTLRTGFCFSGGIRSQTFLIAALGTYYLCHDLVFEFLWLPLFSFFVLPLCRIFIAFKTLMIW